MVGPPGPAGETGPQGPAGPQVRIHTQETTPRDYGNCESKLC